MIHPGSLLNSGTQSWVLSSQASSVEATNETPQLLDDSSL